jgi:NAD kinase
MRLQCSIFEKDSESAMISGIIVLTIDVQIMNEVTVHRGHNVQLASIDCHIGDEYLTDAVVLIFLKRPMV